MRSAARAPCRSLVSATAVRAAARTEPSRQLVHRAASALVHVRAALLDRGRGDVLHPVDRRLAALVEDAIHLERAVLVELRPEIRRRRGRRRGAPAAPPQGADAARARYKCNEALQRPGSSTLRTIGRCYTPAASRHARRAVTRSGAQEAGPTQSMRRRNSGL